MSYHQLSSINSRWLWWVAAFHELLIDHICSGNPSSRSEAPFEKPSVYCSVCFPATPLPRSTLSGGGVEHNWKYHRVMLVKHGLFAALVLIAITPSALCTECWSDCQRRADLSSTLSVRGWNTFTAEPCRNLLCFICFSLAEVSQVAWWRYNSDESIRHDVHWAQIHSKARVSCLSWLNIYYIPLFRAVDGITLRLLL